MLGYYLEISETLDMKGYSLVEGVYFLESPRKVYRLTMTLERGPLSSLANRTFSCYEYTCH